MKFLLSALALIFSVSATSIHAQVILLQEDFDGAATIDLSGTTPAIGTGIWVSQVDSINADGSTQFGGNSLAAFDIGDVINDTKGTPDGLFELTATLDRPAAGGNNWYSIGFSQQAAPLTNDHFLNRNGIGTIILRSSGELDMWAGNGFTPNGLTPTGNSNQVSVAGPFTTGTRTLTVELDLRDWNGTTDFGTVTYFDDELGQVATFTYTNTPSSAGVVPTDPDFNNIILSGNNNTAGNYNSLTLTQIVSAPDCVLADVSMNGVVDFNDIPFFVTVLLGNTFQCEADCSENGVVDFNDIPFFVNILLNL